MILREAKIDEVKRIQISILDEIDDFCKKENIRYFLIAGTLLGAVRHKGYIPWDDDIDICMPRIDYEKFLNKFNGETTSIINSINNKDFFYPFTKVTKNYTITKEKCRFSKQLGINIDVFPIDNIPDGEKKRKKFFKKIRRYRNLVGRITCWPDNNFFKKILYIPYFVIHGFVSRSFCIKKINKIASKYKNNNTKLMGNCLCGIDMKEAVQSKCFDNTVYLEFEGKKYPCPIGYNEWLSSRYGYYMELPPVNERVTHHLRKDFVIE